MVDDLVSCSDKLWHIFFPMFCACFHGRKVNHHISAKKYWEFSALRLIFPFNYINLHYNHLPHSVGLMYILLMKRRKIPNLLSTSLFRKYISKILTKKQKPRSIESILFCTKNKKSSSQKSQVKKIHEEKFIVQRIWHWGPIFQQRPQLTQLTDMGGDRKKMSTGQK
jgi:hypothetical protein